MTLTYALKNPIISMMAMIGVNTHPVNDYVSARAARPQAAALASTEAQQELAYIDSVKAGNVNAFQYLVETYQSRVYNLALRMLGNEQEAQDAAQDAFVQAYTRLASYRSEWRFKTWIMAITSNLCIDRLRRRRIEPMSFSDHTEDPDAEFVSHEPLPEVMAARHERQAAIRAMLDQLAPEDRGMVVMFYWGDMSYEEIARATGSTVNAVKSRLFRARRALAQSSYAVHLTETGTEIA